MFLRDNTIPPDLAAEQKRQEDLNTIYMDAPQCYVQAKSISDKVAAGGTATPEEIAFLQKIAAKDYSGCTGSSNGGTPNGTYTDPDITSFANSVSAIGIGIAVLALVGVYFIFSD